MPLISASPLSRFCQNNRCCHWCQDDARPSLPMGQPVLFLGSSVQKDDPWRPGALSCNEDPAEARASAGCYGNIAQGKPALPLWSCVVAGDIAVSR